MANAPFIARFANLAVLVMAALLPGCTLHDVRFERSGRMGLDPVPAATPIHAPITAAIAASEKAKLPHLSRRERYNAGREVHRMLYESLGSPDYLLIGEVYGGGNGYANHTTLAQAMCKRAAAAGGDVILVFSEEMKEEAFSYATPSYSNTNIRGSTLRSNDLSFFSATASTTQTPGVNFTSTLRFPRGNALVFRHVPGIEALRKQMDVLPDERLVIVEARLADIWADRRMTLQALLNEWHLLLQ